jgi:hypothetical protein
MLPRKILRWLLSWSMNSLRWPITRNSQSPRLTSIGFLIYQAKCISVALTMNFEGIVQGYWRLENIFPLICFFIHEKRTNKNLPCVRHRWQPLPIIIAVRKTVFSLAILEVLCNWSYIRLHTYNKNWNDKWLRSCRDILNCVKGLIKRPLKM